MMKAAEIVRGFFAYLWCCIIFHKHIFTMSKKIHYTKPDGTPGMVEALEDPAITIEVNSDTEDTLIIMKLGSQQTENRFVGIKPKR